MKAPGTRGVVTRSALAGLFVLASFGVLQGSGKPAPAPVRLTASPMAVPRHMAPRLHDHLGASASTNWAGYAVTGTGFTNVKGSWTVPAASGRKNSYSATWTGIDGDNSNSVEQLGTESDVNGRGRPVYYAWFEMYPQPGQYITLPNDGKLVPGDPITAEVDYTGGSSFQLSMTNGSPTHGWSFNVTQSLANTARTSAEWITEAPSTAGGRILPLADFGVTNFTQCQAAQNNAAFVLLDQWIAGGNPFDEITMENSGGSPKATPGAVSNPGSFSVTWNSAS